MSWTRLLANNTVTALPPNKAEIDKLRALSMDMQFILAYDAARTLSLMIVRAAGYRPRTVGGHYNTFLALEAVDPAFAALSAYFDGCRIKRNVSEYEFAGGVSDTDAEGLLAAVLKFAQEAEAWIKTNHPSLV